LYFNHITAAFKALYLSTSVKGGVQAMYAIVTCKFQFNEIFKLDHCDTVT